MEQPLLLLKKIEFGLQKAMRNDRHFLRREIANLRKTGLKNLPAEDIEKRIAYITKKLAASIHDKISRKKNLPKPVFDPALPITAKKDEIIESISKNRIVIISGETGSGKTTQIPKFCLAAGRVVSPAKFDSIFISLIWC